MDPIITTIVAALVSGATASAKDVATQAIKDAYEGLKTLVIRKYPAAAEAVEAVHGEPDSELERSVLAKRLDRAGVGGDEAAKTAAQTLLDAVGDLKETPGAAALFDFDRLRVARNVELKNIQALGAVFRAKDAVIEGDFIATDIVQGASSGESKKNN